ncbi:MAG: protein-glutamate O-methyltransferase CheR [Dermatophilaceae bacterium]
MALSEDTFTFVVDLVRRCAAIELTDGKESLVESRLQPLARQAGLASVDEYVQTLHSASRQDEHGRVVEAMTTNETSWFRDVTPFRALTGHVVPALTSDRPHLVSLRVWSAACSTGQEPYSIAMALLEAAPRLGVKITATDISEEVLRRGRAGRYSQLEINHGLPATMLVQHFARAGIEWELSRKVRSKVTFSQQNLLNAPPPGGPFDVIFLRNVLIYFDRETRGKVFRRMHEVIRPGGFLLLGGAETPLGIDDAWERVPFERGSIYRFNPGRTV